MEELLKQQTEKVESYKCNWCGQLYTTRSNASGCALLHAKEALANALLQEGHSLETINYKCDFLWNLKDEQKGIRKDNCFIISYWQCCNKPAYRIVSIDGYGNLNLWGNGSYNGGYGGVISLNKLPSPHPAEEFYSYM